MANTSPVHKEKRSQKRKDRQERKRQRQERKIRKDLDLDDKTEENPEKSKEIEV